jgi:hypothetical protein
LTGSVLFSTASDKGEDAREQDKQSVWFHRVLWVKPLGHVLSQKYRFARTSLGTEIHFFCKFVHPVPLQFILEFFIFAV